MKSALKLGVWTIAALILIGAAYAYWRHLTFYPATDDAYVKANVVNISPNITGHVETLNIHDNQIVKKGTLLFTIDARPYHIALTQALAALDLAKQKIESAKAQVIISKAKIEQAQAQFELDKKNAERIQTLVKEGKASLASGDDIHTKLISSQQAVIAAKNAYLQALSQLGESGDSNANLRQAKARVEKARLDLLYTKVHAPTDGKLSQVTLRVGDIVHQGQTIFSMIEQQNYWVEANFKETQLQRIRVGQPVEITLDMYPGQPLKGVVESISGSTGSSFSILPPENATGNWVKVTQRIPVRIALNSSTLPLIALGASSFVKVDTTSLKAHAQNNG